MFVGDPPHRLMKRRGVGIDQLHRIGHDRARERPALLSGGLVALIEHPQQLRVLIEQPEMEASGDRLGVLGHDVRRRPRDAFGPGRQPGLRRSDSVSTR